MLKTVMKAMGALAFAAAAASGALAADLAAPKGEVVLTVTGAITNTNAKAMASFDLDMLKAMPAVTFKTTTNWTKGETTFTGVSLKALLAAIGAKGQNLHASALNDYAVDIPVTDAVDNGPIIAYLLDGKPMSLRDKGPLWVIYPFDANPAYKNEEIYSRAIWQLSKIDVQ